MTKVLSSIKLPAAAQANVETTYSGAGLIYYDNVNSVIRVHDGTSWSSVGIASAIEMPIGSIQPWLGASAPSGWLFCTGQEVSRSTYSNLFSIISTRFGTGNGSTTFNVPDLQGFQVIGTSSALGNVDNTSTFRLGTNSAEVVAVHSPSAANHSHTLTYTEATESQHTNSHSHSATVSDGSASSSGHSFSSTSLPGQTHGHTASVASGGSTVATTTGVTRASVGHTHTAPTVSSGSHSHSVSTSSWSAHSAHSHSPTFSLSTSGNTSSATPATHNHTPTISTDGGHAHSAHSYKTYMVHYIIKAA